MAKVSESFAMRLDAITGPFLSKSPGAIKETVRDNMRRALTETADEGRDIVQAAIPLGPGTSGGHLRDDITSSMQSLTGNRWSLTAVVRSSNAQRMPSRRGYTTYIETGVRAGTATYKSGLRMGERTGRVTAADRKAVRSGLGFKGYGAFRKAFGVMRAATKLLQADYARGLE